MQPHEALNHPFVAGVGRLQPTVGGARLTADPVWRPSATGRQRTPAPAPIPTRDLAVTPAATVSSADAATAVAAASADSTATGSAAAKSVPGPSGATTGSGRPAGKRSSPARHAPARRKTAKAPAAAKLQARGPSARPPVARSPPKDGGGFFSLRPETLGGQAREQALATTSDTPLTPPGKAAKRTVVTSPAVPSGSTSGSASVSVSGPVSTQPQRSPAAAWSALQRRASSSSGRRRHSTSPSAAKATLLVVHDSDEEGSSPIGSPTRRAVRVARAGGRTPLKSPNRGTAGSQPASATKPASVTKLHVQTAPPPDDLLDDDLEDGDILTL